MFLAPHFDDVPLSCGGLVSSLADRGVPTTMITLFGGEITDEVTTAFAREKHARWGLLDAGIVVERRRAENQEAARILGCGTCDLGFPDAIYRGERYTSNDAVYRGVFVEAEEALLGLIVGEIQSLPQWRPDTTLFVPLGVGNHVDHCLAFAAGAAIARSGTAVYAYEDCPYAIHTPRNTRARLAQLRGQLGRAEIVPIGAALPRRIDAIAAYETQVGNLFRFTKNFRAAVARFARRVGGRRGPSERYWPVLPRHRRSLPCTLEH